MIIRVRICLPSLLAWLNRRLSLHDAELEALNEAIASARAAHKPTRALLRQKRELMHSRLAGAA